MKFEFGLLSKGYDENFFSSLIELFLYSCYTLAHNMKITRPVFSENYAAWDIIAERNLLGIDALLLYIHYII